MGYFWCEDGGGGLLNTSSDTVLWCFEASLELGFDLLDLLYICWVFVFCIYLLGDISCDHLCGLCADRGDCGAVETFDFFIHVISVCSPVSVVCVVGVVWL